MLDMTSRYDVIFEDVSDDILLMEDCLVQLEPFGSFPVSDFRKGEFDLASIAHCGGEV